MNRKSNKLNSSKEDQEQRQDIQAVLDYFISEGMVVEKPRVYYRLKTNKEIQQEIAEICKN